MDRPPVDFMSMLRRVGIGFPREPIGLPSRDQNDFERSVWVCTVTPLLMRYTPNALANTTVLIMNQIWILRSLSGGVIREGGAIEMVLGVTERVCLGVESTREENLRYNRVRDRFTSE
jgi:hypothetical protein